MQFFDLPLEIVAHIIGYSIADSKRPANILAVNSSFHVLGLPIVHRNVSFKTFGQLEKFAGCDHLPHHGRRGSAGTLSRQSSSESVVINPTKALTRVPDSLHVELPGGMANKRLWSVLKEVFVRCRTGAGENSCYDSDSDDSASSIYTEDDYECERDVKHVKLVLNSLASDPTLHLLNATLATINPMSFTWNGPDPDHNFSCAIVPAATEQLFNGLSTWSRLTHLDLSSISFARCRGRSLLQLTPFTHPHLRTITIQQAVFLHPSAIAACSLQLLQLEKLTVIDAYQESIWGPRIRRPDVERELMPGGGVDLELGVLQGINRIKAVVHCQAKRERLMGGDREMA